MDFNELFVNGKIIGIHTAFVGKVLSVYGNIARVQPLTYSKNTGGTLKEQSPVAAYIPQNIKFKQENITYITSVSGGGSTPVTCEKETKTVITPDTVEVGDIVFCGVSERDITEENLGGKIIEPTRHHDINDSVILAVF